MKRRRARKSSLPKKSKAPTEIKDVVDGEHPAAAPAPVLDDAGWKKKRRKTTRGVQKGPPTIIPDTEFDAGPVAVQPQQECIQPPPPTTSAAQKPDFAQIFDQMKCKICSNLPRPPTMTCANGCIMCNRCIAEYVKTQLGGSSHPDESQLAFVLCPMCRRALYPIREQMSIDQLLKDVPETCSHGCGERGLLVSTVEVHERSCTRRPRPCKFGSLGCPWIGSCTEELAHRQACPYRIYNKCLQSINQHDALVNGKLAAQSARVGELSSVLGILRGTGRPPCAHDLCADLARVGEHRWKADLDTPVARFWLAIEKLAGTGGAANVSGIFLILF